MGLRGLAQAGILAEIDLTKIETYAELKCLERKLAERVAKESPYGRDGRITESAKALTRVARDLHVIGESIGLSSVSRARLSGLLAISHCRITSPVLPDQPASFRPRRLAMLGHLSTLVSVLESALGSSALAALQLEPACGWRSQWACGSRLVSAPNREGYVSFGESLIVSKLMARRAELVIGEIDERAIWAGGDNSIHMSEIDFFVEPTEIVPRAMLPPPSEEEERTVGAICQIVARELIPDRATIQVGVGSTSGMLMYALSEHHDLGVATELIPRGTYLWCARESLRASSRR
jgi:hypothetical protein